ncbi:hypothetical protein [Stenotrophomonas sp. NPDC078853]|uniref:hypothetical protein n=1 Tax=Stenotrophomonas sp. NPDC078853 TaxID=3364534 RepID=UPI00384AFA02
MNTIDISVPTEQGPWDIQALKVSDNFCIHGMIGGEHEVVVTHVRTGRIAMTGNTVAAAAEMAWALERLPIDWSFDDWTVSSQLHASHGGLLRQISKAGAASDLDALRLIGSEGVRQ